jgi:flagellar biosynthetic protein FliQ
MQQAFFTTLLISAPILVFSLVVGLFISVFQAVTQIHDATLTFVPKILAAVVSIVLFGPWILRVLIDFTTRLFISLPGFVR